MATPPSVFPRVTPPSLLTRLPAHAVRAVPLRNLPLALGERAKRGPEGNRRQYELKAADFGDDVRELDVVQLGVLSRLCSVAQTFSYAGRDDVARTAHGAAGRLLKRDLGEETYGANAQQQRVRGYASELHLQSAFRGLPLTFRGLPPTFHRLPSGTRPSCTR